ncbi:MAG: four helix bundle protein [Ignavibacteriales bacterium]|nr:MAG: four helix bundle protein [Ignavibacteriales bacterium]
MTEIFFDHEKLIVYQKALSFINWLETLPVFSNKRINVINQLDRASDSIVLNIAEGNGKYSNRDRCRYFDIACGSALESAGCLDIMLVKEIISGDENIFGKRILKEIVSMLVGLIKSNSDRVYESDERYEVNS